MLESASGVQQGDPLGPLAFALASFELAEQVDTIQGVQWSGWYLGDGTIVGNTLAVEAAVSLLEQKGLELGLRLNKGKCCLWGPGAKAEVIVALPSLAGIPTLEYGPASGLKALGCPVQHPEWDGAFARSIWAKKL